MPKVVMRLKVSPKEALTKIDLLLEEGYELLIDCCRIAQGRGEMLDDWNHKTVVELGKIFMDFSPLYEFLKVDKEAGEDESIQIKRIVDADNGSQELRESLDVLNSYCQQLSAQLYTPLFYIPDKAQVCFFVSICTLEPDSNEDALCRYMFHHHNFHEWVEMEDIFASGFGGNREEYDKQDKVKIDNAYDGVNRKSNEAFDFPVFKKKKSLLCLNLPSRFLRDEQRISAS